MSTDTRTLIFRTVKLDEDRTDEETVGFIDEAGVIQRLRWGEGVPIGRIGDDARIFRTTLHGEREVGQGLPTGAIQSAGLFEGGIVGWMDPDGVVIQAGLIMGEEEVGRVEGANALAAAAALLLLFLPDQAEAERRAERR